VPLFGPFAGKLDNSRESVELVRPDSPRLPPAPEAGFVAQILVDKVKYAQDAPWPAAADGLGPSLQRVQASAYGNDPANWQAAAMSPGTAYASGPLPVIVQSPPSQTNVAYRDVTLGVLAAGPGLLRYQWRFNGSYLSGATNATLLLANLQPAQAGEYVVVVWNTAGSVSSQPARLTVLIPAAILNQPTNVFVRIPPDSQAAPSTNATFRVLATSGSAIQYQWRFNGSNLPGATNATLTISNVQAGDWGEYTVAITDDVATVLSTPAWLYPLVRPGFAVLPVSQSVATGSLVSLSVMATGWPPPFSFEWRRVSPATLYASNAGLERVSFFNLLATNPPGGPVQYRAVVRNPAFTSGVAAAFSITTLADSDGDGIPDQWWSDQGLTNAQDRLADADADGMLNWQEYVAGTNPTNALSVLRLETVAFSPDPVLRFEAVSNRTYTLQQAETLAGTNWVAVADFLARTNNRPEFHTNQVPAANRFLRVVTPRQP
jgi:hypothetical protein